MGLGAIQVASGKGLLWSCTCGPKGQGLRKRGRIGPEGWTTWIIASSAGADKASTQLMQLGAAGEPWLHAILEGPSPHSWDKSLAELQYPR